jgi:hypothetical protein
MSRSRAAVCFRPTRALGRRLFVRAMRVSTIATRCRNMRSVERAIIAVAGLRGDRRLEASAVCG